LGLEDYQLKSPGSPALSLKFKLIEKDIQKQLGSLFTKRGSLSIVIDEKASEMSSKHGFS
jgi:hypothetical protein